MNKKSSYLFIDGIKLLFLFALCLIPISLYGQVNSPGQKWESYTRKELEDKGFRVKSLGKAWRYLKEKTPATGMLVAIDGKSAITFGDITETSYVASVRKSILAMMYGKYVDNGKIKLSQTLKELEIDDLQGLSNSEKRATIEHLITARSGIYHPASNSGDDTKSAPKRGTKEPGEYFLYNNWDFNAAGTIFEKLTGKNIYRAFYEDLAIPLGMQDFRLNEQRKRGNKKRSKHLAYHFTLSTRDMARLGQLMLNKGKWNNKTLISEKWVNRISTIVTANEQMNPDYHRKTPLGYGYMWWVWDSNKTPNGFEGAYLARGSYGQYIAVIPKLKMVVAIKTKDIYGRHTYPAKMYKFLKMLVQSHSTYSQNSQ